MSKFRPTKTHIGIAPTVVAVCVALSCLVGISSNSEANAAANRRVFWTVPYGFADMADDYPDPNGVYQQIEGARSNLDLNQGPAWGYQFKGLKWTGWGTRRAVGSGMSRYYTAQGYRPWVKTKIVLTGLQVTASYKCYDRFEFVGGEADGGPCRGISCSYFETLGN
jgi:hypothetical protein